MNFTIDNYWMKIYAIHEGVLHLVTSLFPSTSPTTITEIFGIPCLTEKQLNLNEDQESLLTCCCDGYFIRSNNLYFRILNIFNNYDTMRLSMLEQHDEHFIATIHTNSGLLYVTCAEYDAMSSKGVLNDDI